MAVRIINRHLTSPSSFLLRALIPQLPHPQHRTATTTTATTTASSSELHTRRHLPTDREVKMDQADERYSKEASDFKAKTMRFSETIMPHIINLYASRATAQDFEIYAEDATFEDPLMRANGINEIKSAFYSIPKVFKDSKIVEYTVEESEVSPGKHEITIDNKQYYKFLGRDIDMVSLIKLYVENGKVTRHEDWWDKKPPRTRETEKVAMFGRVMEVMRRGAMMATHAMMGFGKDPQQND